jgi:hypothetical protein
MMFLVIEFDFRVIANASLIPDYAGDFSGAGDGSPVRRKIAASTFSGGEGG